MAINTAFVPQGNTFNVTTNATPSTASAQLVSFDPTISSQPAAQASGLQFQPPQVRVVNQGTAAVFMSFTTAAHVAVIPTSGTPSIDFPVQPGEDVVFTIGQTANAQSATPYTIQINTISTGASQTLMVSFGEGT
jgi:hypothetical protein